MSNSVADIHPAEAGYPSPAARSNHYDAAEATSPIAMAVAVVATAHSTATLAAAGGSFGRNERRGTNAAVIATGFGVWAASPTNAGDPLDGSGH